MKFKTQSTIVMICIIWLMLSMLVPVAFIGQKLSQLTVNFICASIGLSFITCIFVAFVIPTKD